MVRGVARPTGQFWTLSPASTVGSAKLSAPEPTATFQVLVTRSGFKLMS